MKLLECNPQQTVACINHTDQPDFFYVTPDFELKTVLNKYVVNGDGDQIYVDPERHAQ